MILNYELISLEDLKNTFIYKDRNISHKLENDYIKFKKAYHEKSKFKNLSFKLTYEDNQILCPLTLQAEDKKTLNFFGDEIQVFYKKKMNEKIYNYLKSVFKNLIEENKIQSLKFKIKIDNEESIVKNDNLELIKNEIFVDLTKKENEIFKSFKPNLRNEIKKEHKDLVYEIIDYKNYEKKDIFKMMEMHEEISGKKTRSLNTWKINEDMLNKNNAIISKALFNKKAISYSLFYFNKTTCSYFSSCSQREYFKEIRNLQHKTIYNVIKYMKGKTKYLYLGSSILYSKKNIEDKLINIGKFKSKFSKEKNLFNIYNTIPETF